MMEKKRKPQEDPPSVPKGKKPRLVIQISKLTQEQVEKLQRKKQSTKEKNASSKQKTESETNTNINHNKVFESSSQIVRESPVRHRLSNLLYGSELSPDRDHAVVPTFCDENTCTTKIDLNENQLESSKNPDSVKACLFNPDRIAADDHSAGLKQDEQCITLPCYPEVVTKTCLQVDETKSGSDSLAADGVFSTVETITGVDQCHEQIQSSKYNTVSSLSEQVSQPKSSVNDATTDVSSGNSDLPSHNEVPENEESVPLSGEMKVDREAAGDSGCSSEDNSIDYASGYNTLEVVNTLLSDLNEERNKRIELDERIKSMERTNQNLVEECASLKDMVNDLLHSSKVNAKTVSRGTQINMNISLHRGRAVDRATSPLRTRDPSPDLQLLSSSVGCQTNLDKVEHPKMVSSLSQTDEEVIPPKILVSIACQTELVLPVEVRPQARAAPQSSYVSQRQEMARPNLQVTAPLQHLNFSHSTQASNVFQTAFIPPGQFYPLPLGQRFQQASSFQARQQGHSLAQVFGNRPRTSVGTSMQQTTTTGYQAVPSLERPTVTTQGHVHPCVNAFPSAYNASAYNSNQQRHSVGHSVQTSVQASDRHVYSAPQQNNRARSLQHVAVPQGAVQSRVITEIEQRRVNQTQNQLPATGNQTTRISGQPNAITLQHGYSQQLSSRLVSQPQNQGMSEVRILRNTIPHYQQGNASTNQSAVHGLSMQQSVSQLPGLQTLMSAQADSARPETCQSVNLNASMIQPVQRSISQARTVSAPQLHNTRNIVPVPQSQAINLSFPVNGTTVTTQHAAQLLPVQQSVLARSSNTYNFTVRPFTQATAERNTQVPENDLRVQPSVQSQSLFDEIRRVYRELQQSLDEVTAKKQKEKNTEKENVTFTGLTAIATQLTADYVTSVDELSSVRSEDPFISQGHNLDKAHTRTSGASASLQIEGDVAPESRKARQENNPLLSNKDRHRNPVKTPGVALENTVQRLLAHQNSTLSKQHASAKTSSCVSDIFDGILPVESQLSQTGTSGKNENQPGCKYEGVCSGTSKADKVEVNALDNNEETNKEKLDCQINSSGKRQPISEITSLADEREKVTGASLASEEVNEAVPISGAGVKGQRSSNSDSVFIAPSTPPNRKDDVEKDKDDLYIQLMSPVIPHGFVRHRKDSDSDSVFVVPSSPVQTRNDSEKIKDDLYVNLMSPIIPVSPSPAAKHRSHISQHYFDESETTQIKSLGKEQHSDPSVQTIESADEVINDNPNQTEIGETDYTSSPGPQSTQIEQSVRNKEEGPELLTTGEEGTVDENRVIGAEIELPVAETQEGNTDTDRVKVVEAEIYEEKRPISETGQGQKFHVTFANKDMEVVRSVGGTDDENHVVSSVDPHIQNDCSFVCSGVEEEHSEEPRHKVGEGTEENAGANQGISDTHLAVGCVDSCAENDCQLAPGLVATKDSVESEDKTGEGMETDIIPDLSSPQNVVRMQDSLNIGCSQEEEMETGAKHTRRVNKQETIQNACNIDPVGKNFAPSNTVEDMEMDSIPELRSTQSGCSPDEEVETCVKHTGGVGTEKAKETTQNARNVYAVAEDNLVSRDAVEEIETDATHELSSSQSVKRLEETWKPGCSHDEEVETSVMHSSNADSQKTQEPIENAGNIDSVAEDNLALNNGLRTSTKENSGMEDSTVLSSSKCLTEDNRDGLNEQQSSEIIKGISKQDHFHYQCYDYSAIKEVNSLPVEKLLNEMKNQPLERRQEPKQSLVSGCNITGILVSSNKNHDQNEKENVVKSDSSQQHLIDGSSLPRPRIVVRSEDNDLTIMWDLPDNDNISEIEYFELQSWSRVGQWRKISKIKALRLPMGCTVKNVAPGKMSRFRIRALSYGGVVGPFSEPSSFMSL